MSIISWNLKGYIPYAIGDTLKFTNEFNDTLTTIVQKDSISEKLSYKSNCPCGCYIEKKFLISDSLKIEGFIGTYGEKTDNTTFELHFQSDNFRIIIENNNASLPKNKNLFGDTVIFSKPNVNNYNNIIVVKNKGIIQFYDKEKKCNWTLIDKNFKN